MKNVQIISTIQLNKIKIQSLETNKDKNVFFSQEKCDILTSFVLVKIKESEEKLFLKKEAGGGNILPDGSRNFSTGLHICQDSVNKQNTFEYLREIFLQQRNSLKHLNLHDSSYLKRDSKECFANSLLQILYFLCNLIPVTPISFQSNTT